MPHDRGTRRSAQALLTFAKAPVRGAVKTRLEPALGTDGALGLHEALLRDAVSRMGRLAGVADGYLYVAGDAPVAFPGVAVRPQRGRDLGERLAAGFEAAFLEGHERVVAVGIDSPTMPDDAVLQAFDALERADVTVGPCDDGGYYLIGLSIMRRDLFDGIAWGTASVRAETVRRARAAGLSLSELPPGFDVDRPEDLPRLRGALPAAGASHTAAFLEGRW